MKPLLFITLCGMVVGCGQMSPPESNTSPGSTTPTTVTANRPVTTEPTAPGTEPVDRANSSVNIRDRDGASKTPFDQGQGQPDIDLTAEIRSRVVATKMSIIAQNVKIIASGRRVTLRGPVATTDEKRTIEEIAASVAGAENVDSLLEVTTVTPVQPDAPATPETPAQPVTPVTPPQ